MQHAIGLTMRHDAFVRCHRKQAAASIADRQAIEAGCMAMTPRHWECQYHRECYFLTGENKRQQTPHSAQETLSWTKSSSSPAGGRKGPAF